MEVAFDETLSKQLEELPTDELAEVLAVITDRICTIIQERAEHGYHMGKTDIH